MFFDAKRNTTAAQALMGKLAATGVKEVQLHEPALVMWDSSETLVAMFKKAYFSDRVSEELNMKYISSLAETRAVV